MNLNKKVQYGLLLCLYLARAGRANIKDVSANLNIPIRFLEQIARRLRVAKVIQSIRGPGGGYQLTDGATMGQIINALDSSRFLTSEESTTYATGQPEKRALSRYALSLGFSTTVILNRKVINVMNELAANEVAHFDLVGKGLEN